MQRKRRTYRERSSYFSRKVTERRRELKQMAVDYKGGKCMFCGYNRYAGALDFHHLNPSEKEFSLSVRGLTRSWERIKIEVDKCVLVCANCHREIHAGIIKVADLGKN